MVLLNEEQLAKLKEKELEILLEFDRICRKHDIKYSLTFGTLIGAVRHHGFIPWDDDIDVIMTRDNFNKFLSVVNDEINNKYYYVDLSTNKYYGLLFGKMMMKNTIMKETSMLKSKAPFGIFIDIFTIEKTSKDAKKQLRQFKKYWRLRRIMLARAGFYSNKLLYFAGLLLRIIPSSLLNKIDIKNKMKYSDEADGDCIILETDGHNIEQAIFDKYFFNDYIQIDFEGHSLMIFKNYDSFLRKIYGDYLALPPIEEQIPHHFVDKIDFGDNK